MHWIMLITLLRSVGPDYQESPPTPFQVDGHSVVYESEAACEHAGPAVIQAIQLVEGQAVRVKTRCEQEH